MTVKLVDIAKHVGLSVSTVSRVVNGKDRVSAKTRQRVLDAIKELNYQPNAIARSLRSRSSMTIGIVVPDLSNNFFTLLTKGAGMIAKQSQRTGGGHLRRTECQQFECQETLRFSLGNL